MFVGRDAAIVGAEFMKRYLLSVVFVLSCIGAASAGVVGVQNVVTNLDANGDRAFVSGGFIGSPTLFDVNNAAVWADGSLTNNAGTFGWNTPASRDTTAAGNSFTGNPDRADHSSAFADEGGGKGMISEVFGANNLSHIIDGEDNGAWSVDLFLADGYFLPDDHDNSTIEVAVFERGMNSDVGIRGIYRTDSGLGYTSGVVAKRAKFTDAGWRLDTLEIAGEQKVGGVGVSLDDLGEAPGELIGVQIYAINGFNGPDVVGVLAQTAVPEPSAVLLLACGAIALIRRR